MKKFSFSYDKENDDLFLYDPKSKSKGSVEVGDLILDFNHKKELVGIQIMNASRYLKDISASKETIAYMRTLLNGLKECKVDVTAKNNVMIIKIHLKNGSKQASPVISVPMFQDSSPAVACI